MSMRLPLVAGLAVVAFAGAAVGCSHSGQRLRDAASADLNCPPSRLHILGASRVKDVNGCGHQATYHYEDGDWYLTDLDGKKVVQGQPRVGTPAPPPPVGAATPAPTSQQQPASAVTGTPSMPPSSPPPPAPGRSL